MDERIKAVIDADFFRNITEYDHGINLFLRVMNDLNMEPVMHEFVANVELKGNKYLQQLLDKNMITIVTYGDYLKEADRADYEDYFYKAYERINCFDFVEGCDIYEYKERDESLGEICSLYMARKMGYIYFMSDDADAKVIAKSFFSTKRSVRVQSLFDVLIMCKENNTSLSWKDIKPTVTSAMRKRRDKINRLKVLYSE